MSFVLLLQVLTIALLVVLFITQVFLPILTNRPLFPLFHREGVLLRKLSQLRQKRTERALERRLKQEQTK